MSATTMLGVCDDCNQGVFRVADPTEEILVGECDRCGHTRAVHRSRVDPDARRQRRREHASFPVEFADKPFEKDDDNRQAIADVAEWAARYQGWRVLRADHPDCSADLPPAPAIWGRQGRGKTHLLVRLGERLIDDADCSVLFCTARGLLRGLQQFDRDAVGDRHKRSMAELAWERALTVDVLLLDDLGAQRQTDWRDDQLAELIDERHTRMLPVALTVNVPPGAWDQRLDVRTVSRLRGMTVPVELDAGPDRRQPTPPLHLVPDEPEQ